MSKPSEDILILKYVPLKTVIGWGRNVKRHDLDTIIKSILTHGFKDPLKWEPVLNNGQGGIVEGNGRDQALKMMKAQNPKKPPRGITLLNGDWMVPVLFGVDAKSQAMAESYGFDHNQITMLGGDLEFSDTMKIYQDQAVLMLKGLSQANALPVSISAEMLDSMLEAENERLTEREEMIREKSMLRILISVPADLALDVQEHIDVISEIPGVEVDISGND